jgi:L-lysine 2,3-aminomutase
VPETHWGYTQSIRMIREIFEDRMVPMTLEGIDRGMDVDPEVIRAALPAPTDGTPARRPTLDAIAEAEGMPLPDLVARIEAAIAGARAE